MGFHHQPNLVNDGLVLALDAADDTSFSSGSTTWFDLSPNSNDASLFAGTMGTVSGSNTITFDGNNDSASISNHSSLNFGASTNFTLECVVKLKTADDNDFILGKENGHFGQGYSMRIEESGTSDNWGVQLHVEQADGTQYRFISPQVIGQTYTHIVASFDRSKAFARVHINGQGLDGTTLNSNLSAIGDLDVSQDFTIGADSRAVGVPLSDGQIDIVRVYNKALNDNQALNNYHVLKNRFNLGTGT